VAGIKPGDVLLAVDGTSYAPPSMPPFKVGQTCMLRVSSIQGDNVREVAIEVPNRKGTKSRPPIVEPKSLAHSMIAPKVGLLKIVYFPGELGVRFSEALDAAIRALKEQGCERLIIDLRGNIGGGLGFARLASYLCPGQIPIGHSLTPGRLRRGYACPERSEGTERNSRGSRCRARGRRWRSRWSAWSLWLGSAKW